MLCLSLHPGMLKVNKWQRLRQRSALGAKANRPGFSRRAPSQATKREMQCPLTQRLGHLLRLTDLVVAVLCTESIGWTSFFLYSYQLLPTSARPAHSIPQLRNRPTKSVELLGCTATELFFT